MTLLHERPLTAGSEPPVVRRETPAGPVPPAGVPADRDPGERLDTRRLVAVLRAEAAVAAAVALVVVAVVVAVVAFRPTAYRASAAVLFNGPTRVGVADSPWDLATERAVARSNAVLAAVGAALDPPRTAAEVEASTGASVTTEHILTLRAEAGDAAAAVTVLDVYTRVVADTARARARERIAIARTGLDDRLAELKQELAAVRDELVAVDTSRALLPPGSAEGVALAARASALEGRVLGLDRRSTALDDERAELTVQERAVAVGVQIVEEAEPPRAPVGPSVSVALALGVPLALLLGVLAALVAARVRRPPLDPAVVAAVSAVPVVDAVTTTRRQRRRTMERALFSWRPDAGAAGDLLRRVGAVPATVAVVACRSEVAGDVPVAAVAAARTAALLADTGCPVQVVGLPAGVQDRWVRPNLVVVPPGGRRRAPGVPVPIGPAGAIDVRVVTTPEAADLARVPGRRVVAVLAVDTDRADTATVAQAARDLGAVGVRLVAAVVVSARAPESLR